MRVEANISVASPEDTANKKFGTKTEVKNLNSFRAVERAIAYEIERQSDLLERGEKIKQETRGWDDAKQETYSQRSKESSHDYRYFPDPDIPKLKISEIKTFDKDNIQASIPELPWIKRERYQKNFGMTEKEVAVFVESKPLADYFEEVIKSFPTDLKKVKLAINYILTDYLGLLKKNSELQITADVGQYGPLTSTFFAEIIELISAGDLSSRGAKDLIILAIESKIDPSIKAKAFAEKNNLIQKSDEGAIIPIIEDIIKNNDKVVTEYKAGKVASLQFLIGQAMKATKGSANPEVIKKLLTSRM